MSENAHEELRYWPRIGLYINKADAEEYISKTGQGGAVLDEDVEEFTPVSVLSPDALRREIEELFEKPFEEGEISNENKAILAAISMEQNRVPRIKELIADGMTRDEAKEQFSRELDEFVRESLGLPDETESEKEYRERYEAIHGGEEE